MNIFNISNEMYNILISFGMVLIGLIFIVMANSYKNLLATIIYCILTELAFILLAINIMKMIL